jgi:hypothetical protein
VLVLVECAAEALGEARVVVLAGREEQGVPLQRRPLLEHDAIQRALGAFESEDFLGAHGNVGIRQSAARLEEAVPGL